MLAPELQPYLQRWNSTFTVITWVVCVLPLARKLFLALASRRVCSFIHARILLYSFVHMYFPLVIAP